MEVMELRNFISQALLDILGGVNDAQEKTHTGGAIAPIGFQGHWESEEDRLKFREVSTMQIVEFEVTVRAEKSSGREGKLNVVNVFTGGGQNQKSDGHAATLKFTIPVMFPAGDIKKKGQLSKPK